MIFFLEFMFKSGVCSVLHREEVKLKLRLSSKRRMTAQGHASVSRQTESAGTPSAALSEYLKTRSRVSRKVWLGSLK